MSNNFLDQLADVEVPAPPENLDNQVHQRLNGRLLLIQLVDLGIRGLPYAFLHLLHAFYHAIRFTLIGKQENPPGEE